VNAPLRPTGERPAVQGAAAAAGTLWVTGRGAINPWDCDQWGHMNVQFYLAKASDAQAVLAARLGLSPSRLRAAGCRPLPVADRILFKRELRAGDIYFIHSGVRSISAQGTLDIASRMVNSLTGVEAAAFETRLASADPDFTNALAWPDDVLAAAQAASGELPDAPPPRPMAVALPGNFDAEALLLTYRGSVESWECDAQGIAAPRTHIARFAESANHLFRAMAMSKGELHGRGLGSAALDYDIIYRRPMRVGQAVEVRSGLLNAGDKVFHFFHHLVDSSTGEAITSIVVAAVFFDLVARKSVPLPEFVRHAAQRLIHALPPAAPSR
jgi:acyl-CoA thioester hydrolase